MKKVTYKVDSEGLAREISFDTINEAANYVQNIIAEHCKGGESYEVSEDGFSVDTVACEDYDVCIRVTREEEELSLLQEIRELIITGNTGLDYTIAATGTIYIDFDCGSVRIADHDPNGRNKDFEIDLTKVESADELVEILKDIHRWNDEEDIETLTKLKI